MTGKEALSTGFPCPLGCSGAIALEWEPGDASVGQGVALIGVEGDCLHVGALNMCIAEMDAVAFEESEWGHRLLDAYRASADAWWKEYAMLEAQERLDRPMRRNLIEGTVAAAIVIGVFVLGWESHFVLGRPCPVVRPAAPQRYEPVRRTPQVQLAQAPTGSCTIEPIMGQDGVLRWCTVCLSGGVVTILECR